MKKLADVRANVNREKRAMFNHGTSYRLTTAVYASRLLNELVSSNQFEVVSRQDLLNMVKKKYNLNDERANDVAKSVHVHMKRVNDRERLARYYHRADELMKK